MGGGNQRHLTKMKKSTAWLTCEACGKTKRQTTNLKKEKKRKKKYLLILNEEKRRGVFVHKVKDKGFDMVIWSDMHVPFEKPKIGRNNSHELKVLPNI